ncbi:hypothetical protein BpOF4_10040 [Alkalihalophilus pseudofirmus OF4]|uniref:Uncharacterized protein n=1 Tax=Alkalihalophilus pseudofirmus (strain ATCC BAA-2126 / JCM 17055 / OF4) TaxID=398511 RepID=D3FTJ0_ALKPO|nr:hypothetical protein [Alkalihalophilus marmarensis]ADC50063.1 hypothetical protein BpOF4_10040 [Alkalihalophilus pseudofirmus OF4]
MSMSNIPPINPIEGLDREQVALLLLASIAFEELSLAHIMNAEGEKLQYALGTLFDDQEPIVTDLEGLLAVNRSVERTLRTVIKKEMLLQFKLEDIIDSGLLDVEPPEVACACQINIEPDSSFSFDGGTITIVEATFCNCETGESEFEATFTVSESETTATLVPGTVQVNCETGLPVVSFEVDVEGGVLPEGPYTLTIIFNEETGEFTFVSPGFDPIPVTGIDFEIIPCLPNGNGNGAG